MNISDSLNVNLIKLDCSNTEALRTVRNKINDNFIGMDETKMLSESWDSWNQVKAGDGAIVLSGTDNLYATCDVTASGRASLNRDAVVTAGRVYCASCYFEDLTGTIAFGIYYAGAISDGVAWDAIESAGRWGIIFTPTGTSTIRFGIGTDATKTGTFSCKISNPMIQDITGHPLLVDDYVRSSAAYNYPAGSTLPNDSGETGLMTIQNGLVSSRCPAPWSFGLCVADSFGTDNTEWPVKLQGLISGDLLSYGIASELLSNQMEARYLANSKTGNFTFTVIQGGVNDIDASTAIGTMQTSLQNMVATARSRGIQKIIVCNVAPFGDAAGWSAGKQALLVAWNAWLVTYGAANADIQIADIYTALQGDANPTKLSLIGNGDSVTYDSGDGLHPNEAGSTVIGQTINALIG